MYEWNVRLTKAGLYGRKSGAAPVQEAYAHALYVHVGSRERLKRLAETLTVHRWRQKRHGAGLFLQSNAQFKDAIF